PNIIDFLGLAWGTNHVNPAHRLPVLVVEYGDRGTLADVQLHGPPLTNELKLDICLGIARGLKTLHDSGIIHGDVKPENIIMCSHSDKFLVPKLADFGFAMIESTEAPEVLIGSTRVWRAPEVSSYIPVSKLKFTDVYSFGLVAWSIAIDGKDPFRILLPESLNIEERLQEIDRLKQTDQVLPMSKLEKWIFDWGFTQRLQSTTSHIQSSSPQVSAISTELQSLYARLKAMLSSVRQAGATEELINSVLVPAVIGFYRQQAFYKHLDSLFSHTLSRDPEYRDLPAVISELEGQDVTITKDISRLRITAQESGVDNSIPSKINWHKLGFKSHYYSWQVTRDLEPNIQSFIVNTIPYLRDDTSKFIQAAYFINGYGVKPNVDKALDTIVQEARAEDSLSQAYLYRMFKACRKDVPSEVPVLEYLKNQARRGSRKAMLDLKDLDPEEARRTGDVIELGYGGVGANWYLDHRMLYGLTQSKLVNRDFLFEQLGLRDNLVDISVNERGDRITHAAAAVGAYTLLKELITDVNIPVDLLNPKGETVLLCACRSGHLANVKLLLDNGASASIQSANGESPLHWLLSFADNVKIELVGKHMIDVGGAKVDVSNT
ncbi:hypothetical protein F5B19DRAFT_251216, partial [Rostrohypoxylon terebratum]